MKTLRSKRHRLLCQLVAEIRQKNGLTQRQVALKIGKSHSMIAKIENGERRLDVIEFLDLVNAIQGDPHEILRKLQRP